eukprot:5452-Heterococcus_DN1.PRE.1
MALVLDACAAQPQETLGTADAAGTATSTTTNPDAVACRRLLTRYLEQLCDQLDQFRDELLTAALQPLLRAPPALARSGDLRLFVKALQSALRAGASHLPTAAAAVSALERWWAAVPAALEPHFPDLLPRLDPYLRASGAAAGDSTVAAAQSSQAALEGGPRRMTAKGSATGSSSTKSSSERELQMRILRFLGGLGGKSHYLVVDASEVSTLSSRS